MIDTSNVNGISVHTHDHMNATVEDSNCNLECSRTQNRFAVEIGEMAVNVSVFVDILKRCLFKFGIIFVNYLRIFTDTPTEICQSQPG